MFGYEAAGVVSQHQAALARGPCGPPAVHQVACRSLVAKRVSASVDTRQEGHVLLWFVGT